MPGSRGTLFPFHTSVPPGAVESTHTVPSFHSTRTSPDGSGTFCYYGINYYTKERTAQMLGQIRADRPEEWEVLLPWLEKAVSKYNGFYFLGI